MSSLKQEGIKEFERKKNRRKWVTYRNRKRKANVSEEYRLALRFITKFILCIQERELGWNKNDFDFRFEDV